MRIGSIALVDAHYVWMERPLGAGFSLVEHLETIRRHYPERATHEAGGIKKLAAELLGYDNYLTLASRLDRLGVEVRTS